jgi:ATP-dependent DNA helicase RecQ
VPAYVVFPDRTLAEIAARRPRSLAALADVRGVGPARLDRYGEQFLEAVRTHNA